MLDLRQTLKIIPLPSGDYSNPGVPGSIPFIGTTMSANGAVVAGNRAAKHGGKFGDMAMEKWRR